MENAVEALKMGAAILIFIIAIVTSFSVFGTAKQTADSIILMRDKQAYLESAEVDNGILYTSTSAIRGTDEELSQDEMMEESTNVSGVTKNGDRIVGIDDVVSTILRYSKESYAVTIIEADGTNGKVVARFDMNIETYVQDYVRYGRDFFETYENDIAENLKTDYCTSIKFPDDKIEELYGITDDNNTKYGAPWLGDQSGIQERITVDLNGGDYINTSTQKTYKGKNLIDKYLKGNQIIEVTNEIDTSTYLEDLLVKYEKPTVEIIYIVK